MSCHIKTSCDLVPDTPNSPLISLSYEFLLEFSQKFNMEIGEFRSYAQKIIIIIIIIIHRHPDGAIAQY